MNDPFGYFKASCELKSELEALIIIGSELRICSRDYKLEFLYPYTSAEALWPQPSSSFVRGCLATLVFLSQYREGPYKWSQVRDFPPLTCAQGIFTGNSHAYKLG